MSSIEKQRKTPAEHAAQLDKMQRHISEVCERECRESTHEWHRRRSELAAHDLWVAETEKRLRSPSENDQEPQCNEPD
jgi:hypothetical protein